MTLAIAGFAVALAAALAGLALLTGRLIRHPPPRIVLTFHPLAGAAALILSWVVFVSWSGPRDLPLDAGALVLSLTFVGGGLLFALRVTRLPRPLFVVALHGAAALVACALILIGLLRFSGAG